MPLLLVLALLAAAPVQEHQHDLNRRGEAVMGFDQTTTTHHFVLRADGGDIQVTVKDPADATGMAQIRMHLEHIAGMFAAGNFEAPMLVHGQQPPGVQEMKAAGAAITYTYEEMPAGGVVRIRTASPKALEAVHAFLRFQIRDHKTGDPLEVRPGRSNQALRRTDSSRSSSSIAAATRAI
jgi:hypothetical protein